jgi:Family of unknown function (DUF5681)
MPDSSSDPNIHPPSPPQSSNNQHNVGYKKPPKHSQFTKGTSGNPKGRPKRPVGTSIKEILDGDQLGKNGEVVSKRKAIVIALVNDAFKGNQKAFGKFMKLMKDAGLLRKEQSTTPSVVQVPQVKMSTEEFLRNFGRRKGEPWR